MHRCERAAEVCALQTGHAHVPETVTIVLVVAVVLLVAYLARSADSSE